MKPPGSLTTVAVADFAEVVDDGGEGLGDLLELARRQPVNEMAADVFHVVWCDPPNGRHAFVGQHGEGAALIALAVIPADETAAFHPRYLVRKPAA